MENELATRLSLAKSDNRILDAMINEYLPFIRECVSRVSFKHQSQDDNLTIAMLAFSQSIKTYDPQKGTFFAYANTLIKNRLIDEARREVKIYKTLFSIAAQVDESEIVWENEASQILYDREQERQNLQLEISQITNVFAKWGIDWTKLLKNCPKQDRSRETCHIVAEKLFDNKPMLETMFKRKQLPVKELAVLSKLSEKTIEKYRQYIVAIAIIRQGDFPHVHSFLPKFFLKEEGKR